MFMLLFIVLRERGLHDTTFMPLITSTRMQRSMPLITVLYEDPRSCL